MSHFCKLWCRLTGLLLAACIAGNIQASATSGRDELRSQLYALDTLSRVPVDTAVRLAWGRQRDTTPLLRPAGRVDGRVWQSSGGRPFADLGQLRFLAKRGDFRRARDGNSEESLVDYEPNYSSLTSSKWDEMDDLSGGQRAGGLDTQYDRDVNREIFAYPGLSSLEGGAFDTERDTRGSLHDVRLSGRDYFDGEGKMETTADRTPYAGPLIDAVIDDVTDWLRDGIVNSARTRLRGRELLVPQDADDVGRVASPFDRPSARDTDLWHSHVVPETTRDSSIKIQRRGMMFDLRRAYASRAQPAYEIPPYMFKIGSPLQEKVKKSLWTSRETLICDHVL
ncbi:uncharacterized protein LOC112566898 isoform X2 [Pomacea canaliculata]|uniref:uncharacterized protein LOC112566898 isoform X2 n=1 Tax=Pomacea canaliculata TaxID=400727 RepID=UPI000D727499|nr:uncharacterized protein LOC112566898 isoform X2 [Pomacea canaliculata]